MDFPEEKRKYHRYSVGHLRVKVGSISGLSDELTPRYLQSVDFNRYGIALQTRKNYSVGEVLTISLCNEQESFAEVKGLVCNRIPTDDGYRIGIRFEPENDQAACEAMLLLEREIIGFAS